ncbi:MAG: tetratricopeptide repeat protein, partial [Vicinamibacterales bacterium]
MKTLLLVALLGAAPQADPAQPAGQTTGGATAQPTQVADAYREFLLARRLEDEGDSTAAVSAYERARTADPASADIVAALADLHMREDRGAEAVVTAQEALNIDPSNREAHRVLGTIYASAATSEVPRTPEGRRTQQETLRRALSHLEQAVAREPGEVAADVNIRAMLARVYVVAGQYNDAIPMLTEILRQEPGWQDGVTLLVDTFAAANRVEDAVRWLEDAVLVNPRLYATLGDFYGRIRRWSDGAQAYEEALRLSPPNFDLRTRYAAMLLNAGGRTNAIRARDVLREALEMRPTDERGLYMLSQAELAAGEYAAAEATARRIIEQNRNSHRGYVALAESLAERGNYQGVVDALAPAVEAFRKGPDSGFPLSMLLPSLGFAYQQIGQHDAAVRAFEEVHALAPQDVSLTGYLVEAHIAAKSPDRAVQVARDARAGRLDDIRLARLASEALNAAGRSNEAIAVFDDLIARQGDDPRVHLAAASVYLEAERGSQAIKLLQEAQSRFPQDADVTFELGAVFERQEQYPEAEAAFRQAIAIEPGHAAALNYLGYMFADRGERLAESVDLIKRALAVDPDNGSYLDSLGWAYFKDGQFSLAEEYLRRAADQMSSNSVVQDHLGDVLFSLKRYKEAVEAWQRSLAG